MPKKVLITGAASGIGLATAVRLDRLGFEVWGTYLTEEELARAEGQTGEAVRWLPLDLRDGESVRRAAAALGEGGLFGLVNNAGVDIPGPLEFLPLDRLREQLEVNVVGQLAVTQACLPLLRRAGGRIVFIGSIDGKAVTPFQGAYGTSKHALEALADILRMELSPWGIWVSVIEPGDIATPIWAKSLALAETMLGRLPQRAHELYGPLMATALATAKKMAGRAKPPDTVARAVAHALTSARPRARYMVGADARLRYLLEILPVRWRDRLILGFIKRG
ncbi:MAG: SDR family oxidoreductase [Thermodesulfobacteriota bacterium]